MIIDGRKLAGRIIEETRREAERLPRVPSFAAFVVAPSPATESYLRMKQRTAEAAGIRMEVRVLPETSTTEDIVGHIRAATEDAIIVQLPLPAGVDQDAVLAAIPVSKDADVLSGAARENGTLTHPIAASIATILEEGGIDPVEKETVVVGQGWLVGQPAALWLAARGANVTTLTKESGDRSILKSAEIVVSGAGSPGLITKDLVREGATVIDVGTSELGGSIAGDVAPDVAKVAGLFTPVPGGVGPIAVAHLMRNVVILAAHTGF